jgi:flagellar biosynthesis protein FlhF
MIIKNYVVNDMYEAMVLIKKELGNDAVIVSKREVRQKGITGLFRKKKLEVTAATEVLSQNGNGIAKRNSYSSPPQEVIKEVAVHQENRATEELKEEMQQIRSIVQMLVEKSGQCSEKPKTATNKDIMMEMDFHPVVIDDFDSYCREKSLNPDTLDNNALTEFVKDRFDKKVKVENVGGRIKTFIGPTGVGKTTTIAKLASNEALVNQKKIGLITIDTYRIGAVEQLKIYANILGVPVKVVFSPEDLPEAIEQFNDKDLIFIDSTGRSHKNIHQLNELKTYLEQCNNLKVFLVASMVTKNIDFIRSIENYKKVGFDSLILTKFDETYSAGNILNAGYFTDKPISFICKGQVVPDDIENAQKETLLKYIWGE